MVKSRTKYEIYKDILEVGTRHECRFIDIFYHSKTSYGQLRQYMTHLDDLGMLKPNPEKKHYTTTDKGKMALQVLIKLIEVFPQG